MRLLFRQGVDQPRRQRELGADDDQVGLLGDRELDEPSDVVGPYRRVPPEGRRACVPGGRDQAMAAGDSDVAEYVRSLELREPETELPEASGDAIAHEFERYLRRRDTR